MTDLNTVNLIGRLTKDIASEDFGYTQSGFAHLKLSIAVNRSEKKNGDWGNKASFFEVTVWGKTAENIKQYLSKGKQIAIDGYLDQQRWEKDGKKYSKIAVVANSVQLLGGKNENTQQQASGYSDAGSGDGFPEDLPWN